MLSNAVIGYIWVLLLTELEPWVQSPLLLCDSYLGPINRPAHECENQSEIKAMT